jgi:putative ABC transport system substrate-binding protein
MNRRAFIAALGGAAAWPVAARAQQSAKLPTIGFLGPNTPALDSRRVGAFVQRLRELDWMENRTVAIEYRWAFVEIAAEFVRLNVDVILTVGSGVLAVSRQ